jgi:hypothetical protein
MGFIYSDQLIIGAAIGLIVQSVVLYIVISIATKAEKRAGYAWAQLELIAKIAKAQGVPQEEITATFDAIK